MLILTRKQGQVICIGDDIKVVMMGRDGGSNNQIRIGISAPANVKILRQEIYDNYTEDHQKHRD